MAGKWRTPRETQQALAATRANDLAGLRADLVAAGAEPAAADEAIDEIQRAVADYVFSGAWESPQGAATKREMTRVAKALIEMHSALSAAGAGAELRFSTVGTQAERLRYLREAAGALADPIAEVTAAFQPPSHRTPNEEAHFLARRVCRAWKKATGKWPVATRVDNEGSAAPAYLRLRDLLTAFEKDFSEPFENDGVFLSALAELQKRRIRKPRNKATK